MSPVLQTPSADSVRAALGRVYGAPEYEWDIPRDPFQAIRRFVLGFLERLQQLEQAHPLAYWVLMGIMTVVLVAILVHFTYLVWRALKPRLATDTITAVARGQLRDAAWHLREARRLAEAGRYAEALAHRFTALVLDLDRRDALTFHPSKTPAEYVTEAQLDDSGRSTFAELVAKLYRHLFGGTPCTADDISSFERRAGELRAHIASA